MTLSERKGDDYVKGKSFHGGFHANIADAGDDSIQEDIRFKLKK